MTLDSGDLSVFLVSLVLLHPSDFYRSWRKTLGYSSEGELQYLWPDLPVSWATHNPPRQQLFRKVPIFAPKLNWKIRSTKVKNLLICQLEVFANRSGRDSFLRKRSRLIQSSQRKKSYIIID